MRCRLGILLATFVVMAYCHNVSAQSISVSLSSTETKEKDEKKTDDTSTQKKEVSFKEELKSILKVKTETSLFEPRFDNIGEFFLDKYTGELTVVENVKRVPVRWRIRRESASDDIVENPNQVNYKLIFLSDYGDHVILININTGAMWALYSDKSITWSYKNSYLKYLNIVETGF